MIVVGIDPGVNGAVSLLLTPRFFVETWDFPTLKIKIGRTLRPRTDIDSTWQLMQGIAASEPDLVVIEDIERGGVRPGQAGQAALGKVAGALEAMAVALNMPRHLVPPATWKRALGLTADKDETRRAASRLLPGSCHLWPLAKHDGRAESALLAWYGAHKVLGVKS